MGQGGFYHIPTHVPTVQAGSEDTHAILISSPAGFAELVARAGTPAHLATPETEPDLGLFTAVTTELGDVTLGAPGMTPDTSSTRTGTAPQRTFEGASRGHRGALATSSGCTAAAPARPAARRGPPANCQRGSLDNLVVDYQLPLWRAASPDLTPVARGLHKTLYR